MSRKILELDEINDEQDIKQELAESNDDIKYGEREIKGFDVDRDLEIWENKHERDYTIKITLPEFCCLCPRSGYPDFATINIEYIPAKFVVELKAIKLYINSFMNRNISHEDSINEIYDVLYTKLQPKFMKIVGDFNPRGNVHTVIEITSESIVKSSAKSTDNDRDGGENFRAGARRIDERERDKKRDDRRSTRGFSDKDKAGGGRGFGDKRGGSDRGATRSFGSRDGGEKRGFKSDGERKPRAKKDGMRSISYAGERKASVVKKDKQ